MTTGAREMWLKATQHSGRFLLPRRREPELYRAAEWLVQNGYARWLARGSQFSPGIELTAKPWDRPPRHFEGTQFVPGQGYLPDHEAGE